MYKRSGPLTDPPSAFQSPQHNFQLPAHASLCERLCLSQRCSAHTQGLPAVGVTGPAPWPSGGITLGLPSYTVSQGCPEVEAQLPTVVTGSNMHPLLTSPWVSWGHLPNQLVALESFWGSPTQRGGIPGAGQGTRGRHSHTCIPVMETRCDSTVGLRGSRGEDCGEPTGEWGRAG